MHKLIYTFLCGATFALSLPAGARTEDYFDSKELSPSWPDAHGRAISSGAKHNNEILLYVLDHADREFSAEIKVRLSETCKTANPRLKPRSSWNPSAPTCLKERGGLDVYTQDNGNYICRTPDGTSRPLASSR